MRKLYQYSVIILFLFFTAACGNKGVTSVEISGVNEVKVSSTITLTVTTSPKDATVKWTSSDEAVATVENGIVTGVAEGTVTITAKADKVSDTHEVTVKPADEDVTPIETTVRSQVDTRTDAYVVYTPAGVETERFKSFYVAIEYTVNNEDYGAYITKLNGEDNDVKLFTYNEKFASDSDDLFYYYKNGNQLDTYTGWNATYWQELKDLEDAIVVTVSPATGTSTYFSSHVLAGVSTTEAGADSTQYWNVAQSIEAAAIVNMVAYSGITKSVYEVNTKEAKITPTFDTDQVVYAELGFVVADAYNVSSMGIAADTATGNWYYYSGETPYNGSAVNVDKSAVLMTSTWNEAGYYVPDEDIKMTTEILTLTDEDNASYIVDRLTIEFLDSNRTVVKDYEIAALTQSGTVRFTVALDIVNEIGLPDYMNGAKFENLIVTSATAYAYEEMQDSELYGQIAALDAGTYDILNSNPETAARYQTIIYNPAVVKYDFSTAGKDIYNLSYNFDTNNNAYSSNITNVQDLIDAIPALDDLVAADEEAYVIPARVAYNALNNNQNRFVTGLDLLVAAEAKSLTFHFNEQISEVVALSEGIKELSGYTHLDYVKADSVTIIDTYTKFMGLDEASKAIVLAQINSEKITKVYEFYIAIKDIDNWNVLETINWAMVTTDFSYDNVVNLTAFKGYYEALTTEDFALIPDYIMVKLNSETGIQSYIQQIGYYNATLAIIQKWIDTYSLDLTVKDSAGLVDTTALMADFDNVEADLYEVAGIWAPGVMNETWNFRNNYAGRFDFIIDGGFAKYYPVLESVLFYTDGVSYNTETGYIDSNLVAATNAAKAIADKYVDETTYAGIVDIDNDAAMKILKAAFEGLTENEKNGLVGELREISEWALTHYNYQYDTMAELSVLITALDSSSATFSEDLKEVADLFNTVLPSTSYFFRNSDSPWAPAGFPDYTATVAKLFLDMDGYYIVNANTGYLELVIG